MLEPTTLPALLAYLRVADSAYLAAIRKHLPPGTLVIALDTDGMPLTGRVQGLVEGVVGQVWVLTDAEKAPPLYRSVAIETICELNHIIGVTHDRN